MLEELRRYRNFGTPNYFYELFNHLNIDENIRFTKADIEHMFYNRIVDGRSIFDGCLEVAIKFDIIILENNFIVLNRELTNSLNSVNQMVDKFVEFIFRILKDDDDFHNIFSSSNLSYDIIYKSIQIDNNAFGLKNSSLKQFFLDFGIIKNHPTTEFNSYILNVRYKKLFDKTMLSEIQKRKIGIEEFRKTMEQQLIFGEEAEKFVLEYEAKRLNNEKEIDWVAEYIVNEGYDIASYNYLTDEYPNRFIEVKSYDGVTPYFFWSRNEYTIAKRKKDEYWIYLVNRSEMKNLGYTPKMIQNPFEKFLVETNDCFIRIEKYKIVLNNDGLVVAT